jgi:hypothetical protein
MNNSGDSDDGVKHLTTENWLDPDPTGGAFGEYNPTTGEQRAASGEGWAKQFLDVELAASAPAEVRDMWEVARGVLLYGWFYYPLYALGEHQLRRVADVAVLYRYQQAGGPPNKKPNPEDGQPTWPSFKRRVDWLIENGVIAAEKQHRWDAIRELRNETTHASIRHLAMPIDALRVLDLLAAEIDALFAS